MHLKPATPPRNKPDFFIVLVPDNKYSFLEWHARTVQEARTKLVPFKGKMQPRLDTSAGKINGERGTVRDLQIKNAIKH